VNSGVDKTRTYRFFVLQVSFASPFALLGTELDETEWKPSDRAVPVLGLGYLSGHGVGLVLATSPQGENVAASFLLLASDCCSTAPLRSKVHVTGNGGTEQYR